MLWPLQDKPKLLIVQTHEITLGYKAHPAEQLLYDTTAQYDDLCLLKCIVEAGWPSEIQEAPLEIQPYWNFCEEISIEDGLPTQSKKKLLCKQVSDMTYSSIFVQGILAYLKTCIGSTRLYFGLECMLKLMS